MKPLNEFMEFDHVVTVHPDGSVTDGPGVNVPTLTDGVLDRQGWTLLDGYSGQQGYSGPVMHTSEFIGGGMERDILATPGHYVALVAYSSTSPCEGCGQPVYLDGDAWTGKDGKLDCSTGDRHAADESDDIEGWAVARWIGDGA